MISEYDYQKSGTYLAFIRIVKKNNRAKSAKSIRLKNYNYCRRGWYFITICTQSRDHFFGYVHNTNMFLSETGKIAYVCWNAIPDHFAHIVIDEYIVMPNHIHGILYIRSNGDRRNAACRVATAAICNNSLQFVACRVVMVILLIFCGSPHAG
jgi:hypothetical protein